MTKSSSLHAVIMAGGRGERFWPISRTSHPKQFVSLFGGKPLISIAVERLEGLIPPENILVVTSADLVDRSRQALPMLPRENIIGEPFGRDTAAACALGTAWVASRGGDDAAVAVLTADHLIEDVERFQLALADTAEVISDKPAIGVIGIVPDHPATGYGYIESAGSLEQDAKTVFMNVRRFVEKPDVKTARGYVASGNHFWNSGMFLWSVRTFKHALRDFQPKLFAMAERMQETFGTSGADADADAVLLEEYNKLDRISVDYAIMEKVDNIVAARGDFGWDDVGTWASAAAHFKQDDAGNARYGASELVESTGNTVVNDQDGHLVAVMGVENLVVVHTKDATLVCSRESAQRLKELVKQVGEREGPQFT